MSFLRLAIQKILYQILILLACYTAFRWLFYAFNQQEIAEVQSGQLGAIFSGGLRFDLSALAFLNCLWIILTLVVPLNLKNKSGKALINLSFYLPNIVAILFEVSDWVYFNFNRKRATFEIFDLLFSKGDFLNLLPSYLQKFWYVPIIAAGFIGFIIWSHRRLNRHFAERWHIFMALGFEQSKLNNWLFQPVCVLITAGLIVLLMRGGPQLMPVNARNAVEYVSTNQAALVLNTPFSIITSVESDRLATLDFMNATEADQIIQPIKKYNNGKTEARKNVVVIVWESLSKRFTGIDSTNKSVTPFLDSLAQKSRTFSNAYANALRSNEGVPAIFSGFPAMMEGPVITSIYSNNQFSSLPQILQEEGYNTAFFHGGNNGTMSLDTYSKNAGFSKYFGRTEYGLNKDYDGAWGVWDAPFLQYSLQQINTIPEPFCLGLFTLSSHVPFNVPKNFKPSTPNAKSDVELSMNYTDNALKAFFESAKKQNWYKNTVFLITADHGCPIAFDAFHNDGLGRYQIPIILFDPTNESIAQQDTTLMQQLDITPTLLDYIGYSKPFFSFGNSAFDGNANRYFITYLSGNYNLVLQDKQYKTQGTMINSIFQYPEDKLNANNLIESAHGTAALAASQQFLEAFLQLLHNGMINDQLNFKTYQQQYRKQ